MKKLLLLADLLLQLHRGKYVQALFVCNAGCAEVHGNLILSCTSFRFGCNIVLHHKKSPRMWRGFFMKFLP